uniref:Neuroblastoma-amplified sequence N-terminal domain-containing protein n=1 Tax=Esox lucius TaxID=8010 RepID=A0AAY5KHE6_ESOLU
MAEDSKTEVEEENILYDLLINTEWPPETDTQVCTKSDFVTSYPSSSSLPPGLVRLANKQINWQLVLASTLLLPKDPSPQWRRVAWSHDCTLLAFADSTGTVRVFDLMGSELFIIPPVARFPGDFSYAAAGLIFLEYTVSAQWSAELLVITYGGGLKSYLVSVGTNQSYQENHSFSFTCHYSHGITAALYHPGHRLLLVGGCESSADGVSRATRFGLTAWRALSGPPHYKQVTSYEDDASAQSKGFFRMPSFRLFSRHSNEQDGVFRMSLSPDGSLLAVLHFSGRLSVWNLPSLRQAASWEQEQQPGYEEINPQWKTSLEKRRKIKDKEQYYSLCDVAWWSECVLILARCSGSLSVSSVRTLRNLLGKSCEWFEPSPRVTSAHDGGFLSLECEVHLAHKRGRLDTNQVGVATEEEEGEEGDSESDEESSAKARYSGYVKQGLYYITEMERFAPPRKRPRTVVKNYRLVSLRSTTPEELYQRKIDSEEYGEALSLAQAYGLDSDLVYQRQWRKSTVSIASIQDYLSKIRKRSWVLHECVERVPENVDAAKELLQYGLKGTDLEALIAIGNREDGGRFILSGDLDVADVPYEELLSVEEEMKMKSERENRKRQELLAKINFKRLTLEQKELCRSRLKLLSYLDRLDTYEEILGGPQSAEERYDAEFFKKFRNQNIVLSARTYARESNVQALDILFSFHGAELLQHRLAILYNFPETTSPHEYTHLLPEACLIPWEEQRHRETDWCEDEECRIVLDQNLEDTAHFLYEDTPDLLRFRTATPSIDLLTEWYLSRAQDIDACSRQVDCALSLVRLGKERKIPGLERMCDDLVTMETLVYESACELNLTLRDLQQLSDINKLRLLMKNSSPERYVKDVFQWLVPFLHRCEKQKGGASEALLREYLVTLSIHDLSLPLAVFQHSRPDSKQKVLGDPDQLMSVALECIYSCERDDQLSLCYDILECLPQRGYGPETHATASLHDQVDKLEKHLSVVEVLEKHGLQKSVSYVRSSQTSAEEAHAVMVKLCRHTGRSESVWRGLLQDLLDMQSNVYTCLQPDICYQIFVESLLCSSHVENVVLAGQLMHCSASGQDVQPVGVSFRERSRAGFTARVGYDTAVELVLAAAREYFNSSTTLTDPCMGLARACLQLISDCPAAVQEELDLISALSVLEDLNVKILPLQVRLRPDRLSIVKECVSQCPSAYRQSALLLDLATQLRVAGGDEWRRRGQVLTLLAEQALQALDFNTSYIHCQDLMASGYGDAWEVCSLLGQCEGYLDLRARRELLAFSLTHCPPASIYPLLAASSDLQTQVLYQDVNFQRSRPEAQSGYEEAQTDFIQVLGGAAGDLLHRTTTRTMEALTSTTLTTKAVLTAVGDHAWWKNQLQYLRPLHVRAHGHTPSLTASYRTTVSVCLSVCLEDVYGSYDNVPRERFAEVLIQTGKLAETQSEGKTIFPATEGKSPTNMMHWEKGGSVWFFSLFQVLDANRCFEKQSHSALSLQLAAFYYSLQIYTRLAPCFKDRTHPLYRVDPKELIRLVTQHVTAHSDWPADVELLIGQLQVYNERLTDLTQAQVLQGLGRGVDVQRFSSDRDYKKHTILGLAETLDDSVWRISVSLAHRYNIPLWDIYMTHLEYLFTDSSLSTKEIEVRVDTLGLLATLKSDPDAFYSHMSKYVLPSVEGTDLARLLFFYTLLEACGCGCHASSTISPDIHVKLLKKLRAIANGLNYHKLTDEMSDPLDALEPVLTSQNVLSISKLANRLPRPGGGVVSASAVHATWLKKLFWMGDPQVLKRPPQTDQDFLHAYDTCAKYLDRLLPADAVHFLDEITFSEQAANKLSVGVRSEVMKRAMKALRQLGEKTKKRGGAIGEHDGSSAIGFDDALSHLQQSLAHLDSLGDAFIQSLKGSNQGRLQAYGRAYDLSRSDRSQVQALAVTMATDGEPLDRIGALLRVAVGDLDLSINSILQVAVGKIVSALSGDEEALKDYPEPLRVLEAIVTAVHNNVQSGESVVGSDDLLAWLRPFCGDSSLAVRPRIEVLQILENNFSLRDSDVRLLLLYRTQAVLKNTQVTRAQDEDKRYSLFLQLLGNSSKWEEFQQLMLLLQAWPPMMKQECIRHISFLLLEQPGLKLPALKLMTESKDPQLLELTLDQIKNLTEVSDPELLSLLLDAGLLVDCVSSPLYAALSTHLLSSHQEGCWDVEKAAAELLHAGFKAQAGSLLLAHRGTHPGLSTFSTALTVLRKWL